MPKPGWLGLFLIAGLLVGAVAGWFAGYSKGRQAMRVDAVKNSHARYKVVDDLGNTEFEWLTPVPAAVK